VTFQDLPAMSNAATGRNIGTPAAALISKVYFATKFSKYPDIISFYCERSKQLFFH